MLVFETGTDFAEYYNFQIHSFLTTEFYDRKREVEELELRTYDPKEELDIFFADVVYLRDNPEKCLQVAFDLYYWSGDRFAHRLDTLHLYALYNFVEYMYERSREDEMVECVYFNSDEDRAMIDRIWQSLDHKRYGEFTNKTELTNYLHDLYNMLGDCFEDIDFISFPEIISSGIAKDEEVPEDLLEDYYDLIPRDILVHYRKFQRRSSKSDIFTELGALLTEFERNLIYKGDYKAFWSDDIPDSEPKAHEDFGVILRYSFWDRGDIVIDHEVETGSGDVDFRVMDCEMNQVLIEIKLASNPRLRAGLEKQLVTYMEALGCNQAYYLIICYTKSEIEKAQKFVMDLPETPGKKIVVKILDATKKVTASKLQ